MFCECKCCQIFLALNIKNGAVCDKKKKIKMHVCVNVSYQAKPLQLQWN